MGKYFFPFLTLAASSGLTLFSGCGMGEANKHLDAMEQNTHLMAVNVYSLQEELTRLNSNLGSIAGSMASINSSVNAAGQIMSVLESILPAPGSATVSTTPAPSNGATTVSAQPAEAPLSPEQQRQSTLLENFRRTLEDLQRQMSDLRQQQIQLQAHLHEQQERSGVNPSSTPTEIVTPESPANDHTSPSSPGPGPGPSTSP